MSSPDPSRRAALLALAAAMTVAGCQVRPLYATRAVGGEATSVVPTLRRVAVEAQRDRVGQVLMNELIFAMRGGAELVDPLYRLDLIVSVRTSEIAIEAQAEVPTSYLVSLTATYTLTDIATGRVVGSETTSATSTYDFSEQRFANVRAQRDAEDRAARTAANQIRLRVAAALSAGV